MLHLLDREHLAFGGLARRVADEARGAADEGDDLVAGALEVRKHHDRHVVAGLEAVGRRVEAGVDGHRLLERLFDIRACDGVHEVTGAEEGEK